MESSNFKKLAHSCSEDFDNTELLSWLEENSSRLLEKEFKLVGKVHDFSDEQIHFPGYTSIFSDQLDTDKYFLFDYELHIITNDRRNTGEGYLSINLKLQFPYRTVGSFVLSCVVCAKDSSNLERYHRSYLRYDIQLERKHSISVALNNFISRETLLRESDELLPNDCLKLQVACNLQVTSNFPLIRPLEDYHYEDWVSAFESFPGRKILLLDSKVAKVLRRASDWFQAVHRNEMLEKKQRYIVIPAQDFKMLLLICKIIMGDKIIIIIRFKDFCDMLLLADYYNIAIVYEACRLILKCISCSENPRVREMAQAKFDASTYPDGKREILKKFIESSRETFAEEELQSRATSVTDIEINGLRYTCDVSDIHPIVTLKLLDRVEFEYSKREDFDFYH